MRKQENTNDSSKGAPDRWRYGLWAVVGGLAALIAVYVGALIRYPSPSDAAAALGPALATIGTLTGTYFGIQAGAAGKERSDDAKDAAHAEAMRFAAIADPDRAALLLGLPVEPVPPLPDGGDPGPGATADQADPSATQKQPIWALGEEAHVRQDEENKPRERQTVKEPSPPKTRAVGEKHPGWTLD